MDHRQAEEFVPSQNLRSGKLQVFDLCAIIASQLRWEGIKYGLFSQLMLS